MRLNRKLVNLLISLALILTVFVTDITAVSAGTDFIPFIPEDGSTASGSGEGQFYYPVYVAVDSSGNFYVSDNGNNRIQKFDSSGGYITKWGSNGSGDGQFSSPQGIAVDRTGNVYVADYINSRVEKFTSEGSYITQWGSYGYVDGKFDRPSGVAVDSSDNVYVTDTCRHCIQKFDSNGNFLAKWGSAGVGDGQFSMPEGIAVDSSDNIYVVDNGNNRIQKFNSGGVYMTQWGSSGSGDGQFNMPYGVAVDSSENVYVVDGGNNRIQKFDSSGNFLAKWGSNGSGIGQFFYPKGITADSNGNVYAVDYANQRILTLAPTLEATSTIKGQTIEYWGSPSLSLDYVAAGMITLAGEQAADTTNTAPYETLFDKGDASASVKVVKYAAGGDTGSFDTDTAYSDEAVANGDFFIVRLTPSDSSAVVYYKINVTVSAPEQPEIQLSMAGSNVGINWEPVAGATGYKIYRSTTSGFYEEALAEVGSPTNSYNIAGLVSGTTYYFTVKAVNSGGESGFSNEVSATIPPAAPTLQSAVAGDGHVNISWSGVPSSTGYKIFSSTASGVYDDLPIAMVTDAVYSYDITGLTNGIEYYFVISATNAGGDSAFSNEVCATPQMPAPGAPVLQSAVAGDRHVNISWSGVPGSTGYKIFSSTASGVYGDLPTATVTDSVCNCDVTGLTNGVQYYFVISATNTGGDSGYSNEISATPMSVPGAPTDVTAAAGNGQAAVSFTAPSDNGGSPISGYIVTANPGGKAESGADSPITVTGLTNGTAYTFTVRAVNGVGNSEESAASNVVRPQGPPVIDNDDDDNDDEEENENTPVEPINPPKQGVEILVNGRPETAAASTTTTTGGVTTTTVTVDDKKVEEKLQAEGSNTVLTIPVMNNSDVVEGQLNGQTIRNMEAKEAVLEIKTANVTYTLPAAQINIDDISSQLGEQVALQDIKVNISISAPPQSTVNAIQNMAERNNYKVMVKPIEFNISCENGNKTVEVSRFNAYVERTVAIPDGVDPGMVTTGIVLNADGTFSHVPTAITVIDSKYYAKINSLTNSTYSIIYSPKTFKDVENHWAKDAIDDMGSRLVMDGNGEGRFEPDKDMTRAEFTDAIVRALGLMRPGTGKDTFNDVTKVDGYYDAVSIAHEYGIISGYSSYEFRPMDKVTREEAMTMIARVMSITGLKTEMTSLETNMLLESYIDTRSMAGYARNSAAAAIKAGIVTGRNGEALAPKDNITRAETAAIIRRLLQLSSLI